MKAIYLFSSLLIMSLTLNSCSDHSNGAVNSVPDTVSLWVDGVQKTFSSIEVVESTYIDTNENETVLTYNVLATNENDNGEFIAFQVRRGHTGAGGLYQFIYNNSEGSHTRGDDFNFSVTQNDGNVLLGTFSGPLFNDPQAVTPSATISAGTFDINF